MAQIYYKSYALWSIIVIGMSIIPSVGYSVWIDHNSDRQMPRTIIDLMPRRSPMPVHNDENDDDPERTRALLALEEQIESEREREIYKHIHSRKLIARDHPDENDDNPELTSELLAIEKHLEFLKLRNSRKQIPPVSSDENFLEELYRDQKIMQERLEEMAHRPIIPSKKTRDLLRKLDREI